MDQRRPDMVEKIENLREELEKAVIDKQKLDKEVLELNRQLNLLILSYHKENFYH